VDEVSVRPLYAHVAVHNVGSSRVLDKWGFRRDRVQEAKAPAPDDRIEEFILLLNARGQRKRGARRASVDSNALASA